MTKKEMLGQMEELRSTCVDICTNLWNNPESGGNEQKSADMIRELLHHEGFVIVNEEHLPHAFYAEYGSGKPVIAVLGEYDALPGLSQKCQITKEPVTPGAAGHGCGHNLLGAGAVTGAIMIKRFLEQEGIPGTLRFYGCPEEELLSGKVKMAYYHMFDGCDMALAGRVDRTVLISDGKVSTEKLKKHPAMEYTVLDKAHRIKLTDEMLEAAGIESNKVRVDVQDGKLVISRI